MNNFICLKVRHSGKLRLTGFTLVEIMVSLGIFAVLMMMLMGFFTQAQNCWTTADKKASAYSNARVFFDLFENAYRSSASEGFNVANNGSTCTFYGRVPFKLLENANTDSAQSKDSTKDTVVAGEMKFYLKKGNITMTVTEGGQSTEVTLIPCVTSLRFFPVQAKENVDNDGGVTYSYAFTSFTGENGRPAELGVQITILSPVAYTLWQDAPSAMKKTIEETHSYKIYRTFAIPK